MLTEQFHVINWKDMAKKLATPTYFEEDQRTNELLMERLLKFDRHSPLIFTKVNQKELFFDVVTKFGSKTCELIYQNADFAIEIVDQDLLSAIGSVEAAKTIDQINEVIKNLDFTYQYDDTKLSEAKLRALKKSLLIELKAQVQKSVTFWKRFSAKAQRITSETNNWPMHIGSMFVSFANNNKRFYAPLLLKEVNIVAKNNSLYLTTIGPLKINEDIFPYLEKFNFDLVFSSEIEHASFLDVFQAAKKQWGDKFEFVDLVGKLDKLNGPEVNYATLRFHSGFILGFYQPSSDFLRKTMKEIQANNEVEEVLKSVPDKQEYVKQTDQSVMGKSPQLFYKINETNYSQDRATAAALLHDTIIWGPPGTGKSQVITNIMANVIMNNKTALVVSQKKAALDVLSDRMGALGIFCFFVLNEKNPEKSLFYDRLNQFVNLVENANIYMKQIRNEEIKANDPQPIVSPLVKQLHEKIKALKKQNNFEDIVNAYSYINEITNTTNHPVNFFHDLLSIGDKLDLNPTEHQQDVKKLKQTLLTLYHNGTKPNWLISWMKRYSKRLIHDVPLITQKLAHFNDNLLTAKYKLLGLKADDLAFSQWIYQNSHKIQPHKIHDPKILALIKATNTIELIKKTVKQNPQFNKLYRDFANQSKSGFRLPNKFLLRHQEVIKKLCPIVICTPNTDLSPWKKGDFDYVIIDEASQMYVEKALPILYLGKTKVLVGDDQQMQPTSAVGESRISEDETELTQIKSVLDLGLSRRLHTILLDKNYRSHSADLMLFSSKNFYEAKLAVVDKFDWIDHTSAIEVVNVPGGVWDQMKNVKEAQVLVELAQKNLDKYEKIILLSFNLAQKIFIEELINRKYPKLEAAIDNEQILLKNLENIQGDEADLVIISVAYDASTRFSSTYVGRKGGKNALNVAISRARAKIIVVKSIYAEDIKMPEFPTSDLLLLKDWIKYLDMDHTQRLNYFNESLANQPTDLFWNIGQQKYQSEFLDRVYQEIKEYLFTFNHAVTLKKAYQIGTSTIDLAFLMNDQLLFGWNVDDYHYHEQLEQLVKHYDQHHFLVARKYPIKMINPYMWANEKAKLLKNIYNQITKHQNKQLRGLNNLNK